MVYSSKRLSVLVISFSDISSDSRVLRQINLLSASYNIFSIGYGQKPKNSCFHLQVPRLNFIEKLFAFFFLQLRVYDLFYSLFARTSSIIRFIEGYSFSAVILNDSTSWPLVRLFGDSRVIVDAHEYTPGELSDNLVWKFLFRPFKFWCCEFASYADTCFCVDPYLCRLWSDFSGRPFKLLMNASPYNQDYIDNHSNFRYPLRIVHHGVSHPSRRIQNMILAIGMVPDRFYGTFLLVNTSLKYSQSLRTLASLSNSVIVPPVAESQLIQTLSRYDMAIISIYPSNVNYQFCLPNKFFQCVQARLPMVVGPTPSIAYYVNHYGIGVVADDFTPEGLARALNTITPPMLIHMKQNLSNAARELSWDIIGKDLLVAIQPNYL